MTGRVYVFNGDLENVIESAREYIIENNLDDKDRTYSQLFTKSTNEIMDIISKDTDTGKEREPKEKALMLSLLMSGGLFGEYNFPHSVEKDKAIYIAFNFDAGPDSEYILRSEMELNNEQAAQLAKISNNLSENEYLLIIAKR